MSAQSYWVYILYCDNQTYYTGYTTDLRKRYASHQNGTGKCKYTRSFKPLYLAQCWQVLGDKALAMEIERLIKKLSRAEKEALIAQPETLSRDPRVKNVAPSLVPIDRHQRLEELTKDK